MNRNQWTVLALAVLVAAAAPFVASSNPDGLEKTAEEVGADDGWSISAPLPDYASTGGAAAQALAVVLGAGIVAGVFLIWSRLETTGN